MSTRIVTARRALSGVLCFLLIAGAALAQGRERGRVSFLERFSISLGGGVGFSEGHHGMLDLKSELQFSFTRSLRLGLGFGYLNSGGGHDMARGRDDGRSSGWPGLSGRWGLNNDMAEPGRDFRIVPLSLDLYYVLPLGRRWNVFMSGGGSYYFGSFRDTSMKQHKNTWGGQAGLGVEFRLANRIRLTAEGGYRFAEFHRLHVQQPQGLGSLLETFLKESGLKAEWLRKDKDTFLPRLLDFLNGGNDVLRPSAAKSSAVNLNGFSIRAGLKFSL